MKKNILNNILDKKELEYKKLLDEYNSCNDKDLKTKLGNELISLDFDIEHIKHVLKIIKKWRHEWKIKQDHIFK